MTHLWTHELTYREEYHLALAINGYFSHVLLQLLTDPDYAPNYIEQAWELWRLHDRMICGGELAR